MLRLSKRIDNKHKEQESRKHQIQLVQAREDPAKSLPPAEQSFYFISLLVGLLVRLPRIQAIRFVRNNRREDQVSSRRSSRISFICWIHNHWAASKRAIDAFQPAFSFSHIMTGCRGESKSYCPTSILGQQMDFCGPPSS